MIEGGCLCGGIRYRYDGEIEEISYCHCSQCRKAQGAPFAAVSPVAADRLEFVAGKELLAEYRSSPDKVRVFCARCGSPSSQSHHDAFEAVKMWKALAQVNGVSTVPSRRRRTCGRSSLAL